jgi:hypothetical protein
MVYVAAHERDGGDVCAHFRHKGICTETTMGYHPETQAHLAAKAFFATILPTTFPALASATCEIECRIPAAQRIADLCFVFADGRKLAAEIQLAALSQHELRRRTEAYHRAGIAVWWILGHDALQHKVNVWAWYGGGCTVNILNGIVLDWNLFGVLAVDTELPPGWSLASCDYKGNHSPFGVYWTPTRSDGHSAGIYLHRDSAIFWAHRDQRGDV